MRINHNISALNTYNKLTANTAATSKSLEKLSSGLKINKAGDNAAGLAISEKMRSQIRGLDQASTNANDGISLIQTAEGALNETHSILQRMRELAVQSSNDTNTTVDRSEIQKEVNQLTSEINRIGNTTEFNTKKLLTGDLKGAGSLATNESSTFKFAIGSGTTGTTTLSIGGSNYNITFATGASGDSDPTVDALAKTITVYTSGAITGGESGLTDKLISAFQSMRGIDPSLSISEFTFTKDAASGTLTVAASATGLYAGSAGEDSISFASGRSVVESNVTEGANGADGAAQLQIGANNGQAFTVSINDMRSVNLGISSAIGGSANGITINDDGSITSGSIGASFTAATVVTDGTTAVTSEYALDVSTHDKATKAIEVLDSAIKNVSAERSKLGSYQNRLEHTINNLGTSSENLTSAESRIRDVDMAKEMMEFTKNNILSQAAQSMLAQANQQPQGVLQLLQ
jgi:flagellin